MVFNRLRSSLKRGLSSGSTGNNSNETSPSSTQPQTPTHQASDSSATSSNISSWSAPQLPLPSWIRASLSSSHRKKSLLTPKDPAYKRLNKPFTPQNLEHQKMFSAFDWNLATENGNSLRRRRRRQQQDDDDTLSFTSGISPCASLRASIDNGYCERDDEKDRPLPPDDRCIASPMTVATDRKSGHDATIA